MKSIALLRPGLALAAALSVGSIGSAAGGSGVTGVTSPWACNPPVGLFGTACVEEITCQETAWNYKEYVSRSCQCCYNGKGGVETILGTCYNTDPTPGNCCRDLQSVATVCASLKGNC